MKKLIGLAIVCGLTGGAFGQGLITLGNNATYSPITTNSLTGSSGLIATSAAGTPLYYFGLFWGTTEGDVANQLIQPLAGSGSAIVVANSGLTRGTMRSSSNIGIPGTSEADAVRFFQVRAWSANYGIDYAAAHAAVLAGQDGYYGESAIVAIPTAFGTTPPSIVMRSTASSLTIPGFVLNQVPEPSTMALVGLGLMGLLFIRRRK